MPRSGYGARTTFETSGDKCEDWYGKGDIRCFPDYAPTGDLSKDIELINGQMSKLNYEWNKAGQGSNGNRVKYNNLKIILEQKKSQIQQRAVLLVQQKREKDAREKLAREQEAFLARIREEIIRTTAKPKETVIAPPETVEEAVKYSPLLIAGIGIIVFIIILRRRA